MLLSFRIFSVIEGLSLLLLLFVAMPLKYYFDFPLLMAPVGWSHGFLWLFYVGFSVIVSHFKGWSLGLWLLALITSVLPFGFVLMEWQLARKARPSSIPSLEVS